MLLKSIELENIRSYEKEKIAFPTGSLLLSGDIGSGKSTVLLAIDFALFGTRRGELSGNALLRHGQESGKVRFSFELDGKDIEIERSLKRMNGSVVQDKNFITVDGMKESKTPLELKSAVLKLFNYPCEMVRKSKSLIYRYTVYTPQESMKHILIMDRDNRLNILRKIFDLDKYQRIQENARELARHLRSSCREIDGFVSDLNEKLKEKEEKEHELGKANLKLEKVSEKLSKTEEKFNAKKEEETELEKIVEENNRLKEELAEKQATFDGKKNQLSWLENELNRMERKKLDMPVLKPLTEPEITKNLLDKKQKELEVNKEKLLKEKTNLMSDLNKFRGILERGVCDVCGQKVYEPLKFSDRVSMLKGSVGTIDNDLQNVGSELLRLQKLRESVEIYEREKSRQELLKKQAADIVTEINRTKEKIMGLVKEANELEISISGLNEKIDKEMHKKLDELTNEIDEINLKKMELEKESSRYEQQISDVSSVLESLGEEIEEKQKRKEKLEKTKLVEQWISEYFINLMFNIERHVMVTIRQEFDVLFQKWFNMLIDDELLTTRIDDSFSVILEQNGYETEYENLSGGEKTSVALAYRLALNKVINSLVENIRTKDIIILDEPTDGFSTDQLEKIRDVLDELGLKQTIIVSHEPKIDTFVDNVIRFSKENHVSKIVV